MLTSDRCCPLCLSSVVDVMVVDGGVKHWRWERDQFKFGGRDSVHVVHTVDLNHVLFTAILALQLPCIFVPVHLHFTKYKNNHLKHRHMYNILSPRRSS